MHATAPILAAGEIHVATIQIAGQAPYHLILLPDRPKDEMTHQAATEWAASLGGDLPTRPEQALLFAHQREQFDRDWYWSNTLDDSDPDYAWCQSFYDGSQYGSYRYYELRARAVRRSSCPQIEHGAKPRIAITTARSLRTSRGAVGISSISM